MNGYLVAQGLRADGPGLAQDFLGVQLVLHKEGAPAAVRISVVVRGQERKEEGKLSPPLLAPHFHHGFLELVIAVRLSHVGAALIPEDALGGVPYNGFHAAVPDEFRSLGPAVGLFLHGIQVLEFLLGKAGAVYGLTGHPGLDAAAAPGIHNDAHGHAQGLGQALSKEVCHGRSLGRYGAVGVGPNGIHIGLGLGALAGFDVKDANQRSGFRSGHDGLRGTFHFLEAKAGDGHLHIGLSAAKPDFSQHNVVHRKGFLPGFHRKRVSGARSLSGGNAYPPGAIGLHRGPVGLAIPDHFHLLARVSPPPNRGLGFLLQDGVVGENVRKHQGCQENHALHTYF